ncbi:hypothetical protein M758_6G154700 [Ceratodon purpureus]|nr:hypothetical protein M758_6G154700 [Ceratodon purpureus]
MVHRSDRDSHAGIHFAFFAVWLADPALSAVSDCLGSFSRFSFPFSSLMVMPLLSQRSSELTTIFASPEASIPMMYSRYVALKSTATLCFPPGTIVATSEAYRALPTWTLTVWVVALAIWVDVVILRKLLVLQIETL